MQYWTETVRLLGSTLSKSIVRSTLPLREQGPLLHRGCLKTVKRIRIRLHPPLSCVDHELLFIISCSMSASCFTHWSRRSLIVATIWSCFSGYLTRSSCKEELKLRSYFEERYLAALSKSNLCTKGPFHSRQINFGPNWRYGRYTVTFIDRKPLFRGYFLHSTVEI